LFIRLVDENLKGSENGIITFSKAIQQNFLVAERETFCYLLKVDGVNRRGILKRKTL